MNFNQLNKQEKFSIRKYKSFGAASAVIGAIFFLSGGSIASANESQPTAESITQAATEPKAATDEVLSRSSENPTSTTRSRRGKRDVSADNRVLSAYVAYDKKKEIPVSGLKNVESFDYTSTPNPSTTNDGSIYNNAISKLEKIDGGSSTVQRYRLTLKDGEVIPSDGKIVFAGVGFGYPDARDLVIGTEVVGTVGYLSYRGNEDPLKDRLASVTKIDDYLRIIESSDRYDLPLMNLNMTFNKNFEKYDRNRVIEFSLTKNPLIRMGEDLTTREYTDGFPDSRGILHKEPESKRISSYLLNPYDPSKVMTTGEARTYASKNTLSSSGTPSNEVVASVGYKSVDKPFYLETAYAPAMNYLSVTNGDPNASEPVLRAGDTFKTVLSENSLFRTASTYKVGDIVSVDVSDTPSKKPVVTGNRFTDSNVYVTTTTPTNVQPLISKPRFELLEKTDRGYTWKLLDDVSVVHSDLYSSLGGTLTPMVFRPDWVERFGIDNFKRYMTSNIKKANDFATEGSLDATVTYNIKGVETSATHQGLIEKNSNFTVGDSTTGTVKVVHKTDAGAILKETSSVVTDQSWYTVVNVDPQQFDGYQFKSSSEALSTIAGKGERTIELVYTQPKTVTKETPLKVTYVVDNSKEGTYRNEVTGRPTVTTTRTDYIYSPETRTAAPKDTVTVAEGSPTVVTLGTKPTTEVTYRDFNTRYVADPTRTAGEKFTETEGVRGTTTTVTTYSVNTETGVVTPTKGQPQVVAPTDKVVKVGTRPNEQSYVINYGVEYQRNDNVEANTPPEIIQNGVNGRKLVTTTYVVNSATGNITPNQPTEAIVASKPVIMKLGTKSEDIVTTKDFTRTYVTDKSKETDYRFVETRGIAGKTVIHRTYSLPNNISPITESSSSGNAVNYEFVTAISHDSEPEITEPVNEVIRVGAKDKVVTETLASPVRFEKDDQRARGEEDVRTEGRTGTKVTTTTYEVNPNTGEVIPTVHEPVITPATETVVKVAAKDKVVFSKDGNKVVKTTTTYTVDPTNGNVTESSAKETISEDGAKDKVVTEEIEPKVVYSKDSLRELGSNNITITGKKGVKSTPVTYTVNEKTGELEAHFGNSTISPTIDTIVKVAAKDKVEIIRKDGETIERTTRYTIDPITGEVSSESSDRLIASSASDGEGNVIPAPTVEIPEYPRPISSSVSDGEGNVIPAPTVEIPEFKGGVVPIDAPVQEIPALEAPVTDHQKDVPSIETRHDDKINASKDAAKSDDQLTKRLPNTGQSSDSAGVAGLMLAGLACYLKRKRS